MVRVEELLRRSEELVERPRINLASYMVLCSTVINRMEEGREKAVRELAEFVVGQLVRGGGQGQLEEVSRRYEEVERAYRELKFSYRRVNARLTYRGLVGLGESFGRLAFEVGLSWDPLLQLPYYPGSGVKGAARAIAKQGGVEGVELSEADLKRIFGYIKDQEAKIGTVIFHDAYPVETNREGLLLVPDVLTPIYKEELEAREDPLKGLKEHLVKPTPITFLAIAEGVRFEFLIASRSEEDLKAAEACLKAALRFGIGAKTSVGYSMFEVEG